MKEARFAPSPDITTACGETFSRAQTEILEMLVASRPREEIFTKIALLVESLSPVKSWCAVFLPLKEAPHLLLGAAPSIPENFLDELQDAHISSEDGTCGKAISTGKTVIAEDMLNDPEYAAFHDLSVRSGIRASWTVPVFSSDNKIIAVLTCFYHCTHHPKETEIQRAEDIRYLVSLAIEKSQAALELSGTVKDLIALNRAFAMLSSCNLILIRASDEKQLLTDVCRVATEAGGYRMAWVGYADYGPEKQIIPQAQSGDSGGYLQAIKLSYARNDTSGNGPGARTIRSGQPVVCDDIRTEPPSFTWKEEALRRGFGSLVCLPLKDGKECFGFLALVSEEVNAVSQDELKLLQELADNLAYGIAAIRSRRIHEITQDAIVRVAQTVSYGTGQEFYKLLTRDMVDVLSATGGLIGKLDRPSDTVESLAYVLDGMLQENICYSLRGTPCEQVTAKHACVFEDHLANLFPDDHILIDLGIRSYAGIALFNKKEEVVGVLSVIFKGSIRDVSLVRSILQIFAERAASEMDREEADARILDQASLLDKARDAIFTFDLDHRIRFWNRSAERLYACPRDQATGKSARELFHHDTRTFDRAFADTLSNGAWIGEIHQKDLHGKALIVESRWNLVRDPKGGPESILAINTDITEHRRLEQQFLRAQRLESIGNLAGGLAHDINNVLTPITMSIELLRTSVSDQRGKELLDTIASSARRGSEMVGHILTFARGEDGERVRVSGKEIISELMGIIRDTFPKEIQADSRIAPDLHPFLGDSTQIHQVLLNLCVNARDSMPKGGRLIITASNETIDEEYAAINLEANSGNYVCFSIEDTGQGISPDVMGKIYDPFFTTKAIGKGTGLGLSTALAIVKSHGGFIASYSEPGKGTCFKVSIPSLEGEDELDSFKSTSLPRGNGETILVIDDDSAILHMTCRILENFGYRTLSASSGLQALEIYREKSHDIRAIITDMMMPGLDGVETIHALLRINPAAEIIAVSGIRSNGEIAMAVGQGVRSFIQKPFTAEVILTSLETILKN